MATYQQWSQSYFTDLTSEQHNVNNQWFQCMRDRLTDSEIKERIESLYDEELYDELVDNVNIEDEDAKLQHLEEIKYDREVN